MFESITIGDITKAITFLTVLIGGIEFLALRMRKFIQREIKPLKVELRKNSLNTMKNTICNDMIPLSERVTVGREYIEQGGNGAVKVIVHTLEEDYEKEVKEGKI